MIHIYFQILNICSVQLIGQKDSLQTNLQLYYYAQNTLPVVLDLVTEFEFGKYTAAFEEIYFRQPGKTWRPSRNYHFRLCPGSGSATLIFTQWAYKSAIKLKPQDTVMHLIFQTLLTMRAFSENPRFIFIETTEKDLQNNNYVLVPITSHIILFTN